MSNGAPVQLPLAPMMRGEVCYVPLRPLVAAMKGTVQEAPDGGYSLTVPGLAQPALLPKKEMSGEAASLRETNLELYLINIDGTGLRRLTYGQSNRGLPSLGSGDSGVVANHGPMNCTSPDGTRRLTYVDQQLKVTVLSGAQAGNTFTEPAGTRRNVQPDARFSADGKFIVFYDAGFTYDARVGLCVADADLQTVNIVRSRTTNGITQPQFLPDGAHILCNQQNRDASSFEGTKDGPGLYLVNCDGTGYRHITPDMYIDQFRLLPDGKRVLFASVGRELRY